MNEREVERLVAGVLMVGLAGLRVTPEVEALARRGIRSFILFSRNCGTAEEVRRLTAELREIAGDEVLIAVDHEGGAVNRLPGAVGDWPSQMAVAATGDLELAEEGAYASASQLKALGLNVNFAPVADVLRDIDNPILGTRAYSDDPGVVGEFAAAAIRGHQRCGVAATSKHFPGHGATPTDSHLDLPVVSQSADELRHLDLVPFRAAVEAGVDCLMVSHVWYRALDGEPTPATLSPNVVDLARHELGFEGVITTDCLEMGAIQNRMSTGEAAVRAVLAGCDLPIVSHRLNRQEEALTALTDAALGGALSMDRVRESLQRLETLRATVSRPAPVSGVQAADVSREIARRSVVLLRNEGPVLPLRLTSGDSLALIRFAHRRSEAESAAGQPCLGAQVARRHGNITEVEVDGDLSNAAEAYAAARASDAVLLATANVTGHPRQGDVVSEILELRKPTAVIATRDPFDLCAFPEAPCYLATFGDVPTSASAAAAVIFGELAPTGRLPVDLAGLYPRGSGIRKGR